jgi:hypothetical protein
LILGETSGGVAQIKGGQNFGHKPEQGAQRQAGPGIGARGEAKVKVPYQLQSSTNKILDITTLKKQPKLL